MDWAMGLAPQTGEGHLGPHRDGMETCLIVIASERYIGFVTFDMDDFVGMKCH